MIALVTLFVASLYFYAAKHPICGTAALLGCALLIL